MKKTKRLSVAIALLLTSAVLLATASYAWFAMNTATSADGLEVEAYTDSTFIEISQQIDGVYAPSTVFESASAQLRLITHGFANANVFKLNVTTLVDGARYSGSGDYYKKVESDFESGKYNYIYANSELSVASSVAGLYKDIVFVLVTSDALVSGTYYERVNNEFVAKVLTNKTAKGLYTVGQYNLIDDDDAVAEEGTTYYELSAGKYVVKNGLVYDDPSDDSDSPSSVDGLYTFDAPTAETAGTTYEGAGTYYSLTDGTYNRVNNLELGTLLKGGATEYFTLTATAATETTAAASTDYYLGNLLTSGKYDYSYLGISEGQNIASYLYWGRAYSDDPTAVQAGNTLNMINPSATGDADTNAATNYYLLRTVYIRSAEGTNHATNLKVDEVIVSGATNALSPALRVLFVASSSIDNNTVISTAVYDAANASTNVTHANGTNLFDMLLGNEAETVKVDIYVYFDGTDDAANNATYADAVLNGQSIEVVFGVDEHPYN